MWPTLILAGLAATLLPVTIVVGLLESAGWVHTPRRAPRPVLNAPTREIGTAR